MLHSVRPPELPWFWNHISCSPEAFEGYLIYLKDRKYNTVLLPDVVAHIHGEKELPPNSIALTFDDGYLDNWTIAAPLLREYGFRGTVFVNPSFVDPRDIIREQVPPSETEEVGRELVDGFMSWPEMREAMDAGVLDVQSHGMTHTWYPSSEEIIDFHRPGDRYPWLAWNAFPDRRYLWLTEDQSQLVPYGAPIYLHEKSFIARRYFESDELTPILAEFVEKNGGERFFQCANWREVLLEQVALADAEGCYETEDEYRDRVEWELTASRDEISQRLNKEVNIVCWPGGGQTDVTHEIAQKVGYIGWTVRGTENAFGCRPTPEIGRISIPVPSFGRTNSHLNSLIFAYMVEGYRGSFGWKHAKWLARRLTWLTGWKV